MHILGIVLIVLGIVFLIYQMTAAMTKAIISSTMISVGKNVNMTIIRSWVSLIFAIMIIVGICIL